MQERSLRVLEFYKIRDILTERATSAMGKARCQALVPSANLVDVQNMLAQTEEAAVILARTGHHPVPAFDDVTIQLQKAKIGSVLSARDLLLCADCMRAARQVRQSLHDPQEEQAKQLSALAGQLLTMRDLEEEIVSAILSEEEIADNASSELSSIRRKMRIAGEKVREKLNSFLHNPNTQKYLQEIVITVRNGRYVLPVKQEYRQQVPGLIHDQSGTGSTLFIEPMAVVELGNDMKQLAAREHAEIERILADFTARLTPYVEDLTRNLEMMAHIDFVFAKGALARSWRCNYPKLNEKGKIHIKRGRHPLIDPAAVVPIDLWIGEDFTSLIVTGPNTGGKTVTLKTVGLFTLMMQAGLQVPAELGTELSLFDDVFADIGDEQSIEQSLSTFSSHMTNIVSILGDVTPRSLALFDELGAGTDPTEGASLAQSILSHLLKQRIITLATTHYSELKAFALSTDGVQNASVEFNVETLRPTYRLSIGIPGKSNAFEISRRLGLPEGIIEDAKTRLTDDQIRFEDVISNAEYNRQIAEKEREIAEEARMEIVRLQDQIEKQQKTLEEQKQVILQRARQEARQIINRAKAESEHVISELKKTAAQQAEITRQTQQARSALDQALADNTEQIATPVQAASAPPETVNPGDTVLIVSLNVEGTALTKPNDRGQVQVQAGVIKMMMDLKNLRLQEKKQEPKKKGGSKTSVDMRTRYVALEIDVRGQLLEEAMENVDKYLDDAYLASLKEVSIIHGKGTGALRSGLQEHFKRHMHIKSFRQGNFGEGESGVTVVTLK